MLMKLSCNKEIKYIFAQTSKVQRKLITVKHQKTNYKILVAKLMLLFLTIYTIPLNAQSLKVIDKNTLGPIPYASVELYEIQIQSYCDENGEYEFGYLSNTTPVIISANGYKPTSFIFKAGDTSTYNIKLENHIFS